MLSAVEPLTMSVAEFVAVSGMSEYVVRQEIALGRIPHRKVGRRGLVRILKVPALAELGFDTRGYPGDALPLDRSEDVASGPLGGGARTES